MGHHYIPRYYLRGFSVGSLVWVYDTQTKRRYQTQVKSTANETDLYSAELETFFSEQVEQPANKALDNLRTSVALLASNQRRDLDGRFFRAAPNVIKELNRRTAHNTQRFAYAQRDEQWILPFLLKKERHLPRFG